MSKEYARNICIFTFLALVVVACAGTIVVVMAYGFHNSVNESKAQLLAVGSTGLIWIISAYCFHRVCRSVRTSVINSSDVVVL
jgi:hypothetical protein